MRSCAHIPAPYTFAWTCAVDYSSSLQYDQATLRPPAADEAAEVLAHDDDPMWLVQAHSLAHAMLMSLP